MTSWTAVEAALNGILDRRWYTNHGPLARLLEAEWEEALGRRHVIAVANPTIGLIMLAEALGLSGEVALSALAPPRCAQALAWAGLRPVFCDVEEGSWRLDHASVGSRTVLATPAAHPDAAPPGTAFSFGDGIDPLLGPTLIDFAGLGDDAGSAGIVTDDDDLAGRLRNIRSSYGAGRTVPVRRTANGRLSEAQAAMALLFPRDRSFQSRALAACAELFPRRRLLPYGRQVLIAAESRDERPLLLQELRAAGLEYAPIRLDPRAAHCRRAAAIATRAALIEPPAAFEAS
jgi:hypothetical protein